MNKPEETKNRGTRGMCANIIWVSLVVIVMAGCFASNLGGAWMGGPANLAQFMMTVAYIIFWGMFTFRTRRQSALIRISVVISVLTFIGAVSSLMMRLINSGFILAAVLSTFASVVPTGWNNTSARGQLCPHHIHRF